MNPVFNAIKMFVTKLNDYGVPLPMIRVNGAPSMTATMAFISFNTALLGQVGKIAGFLGGVDLSQANYLFLISLGAYLGRRVQGNGSTKSVDMASDAVSVPIPASTVPAVGAPKQ